MLIRDGVPADCCAESSEGTRCDVSLGRLPVEPEAALQCMRRGSAITAGLGSREFAPARNVPRKRGRTHAGQKTNGRGLSVCYPIQVQLVRSG